MCSGKKGVWRKKRICNKLFIPKIGIEALDESYIIVSGTDQVDSFLLQKYILLVKQVKSVGQIAIDSSFLMRIIAVCPTLLLG